MKKHLLVGFALILIITVAIFGNKGEKSQDTTLTIGVIVPLSGNFAVFGERISNGFELAKEHIAGSKEVSVRIIYEDACIAKDSTAALLKLIERDRIDILGGSFCVAGFVPLLPILKEHNILAWNTAPSPESVLGNAFVVSTNSSIKEKAYAIAEYAYTTLGARTGAIIYYQTPLGEDYNRYITQKFEELGGKIIIVEPTLIDATDFRTQLSKVKSTNPDILFPVQLANPLGNLLKQSKELGIQAHIMGNPSNDDPTVIAAAGKAAEGFITASDEPMPKNSVILDFEQAYEAKFGQKPDVYAANAYDSLMLQVSAYKACGTTTECLRARMLEVKDYEGVSGRISINPDGTAHKPTSFKMVENGVFVQAK